MTLSATRAPLAMPSHDATTSGRAVAGAPIIQVENLSKVYAKGFQALKQIDLTIRRGEIFALLGPNGAGKTTLISIICGLVRPGSGRVVVGGHDIVRDFRAARTLIGLVPQEKIGRASCRERE